LDRNPAWLYKTFVAGVIVLFIGVGIQPAIANNDDTTPPVTVHTLDPPEPDGNNGWYVSDVIVTLNATDDISGVKEIRYTINNRPEQVITGDFGYFILKEDSLETRVEYWAIDIAGNVEPKNAFIVYIDQTKPDIHLTYEVLGGNPVYGWDFEFTATCSDDTSGMERVEFYLNGELQETVFGPGPSYVWTFHYLPSNFNSYHVKGLISNLKITEEHITFYAIIVIITKWQEPKIIPSAWAYDKAGNINWDGIYPIHSLTIKPGFYLFQSLTLPNDFEGYLGRFLISAEFKDY
jgi:hypothetical protein